jgi:CubicO group peptidase (beta-lactamase class C family)
MVARFAHKVDFLNGASGLTVPIPNFPPELPLPSPAAGQRDRFAAAYSVLERAIAAEGFPGAAFAVLQGAEIVALDGIGRFTYDVRSSAVTRSTVYDLASLTKVLATTSMAMLLNQRGALDLDLPIAHWIPGFAPRDASESARQRVTVRTLLAHCSGLPGYARLFEQYPDREALIQACTRLPLEAEPGARAEYSDPGFILLGEILARIAGEPLDRFCAREVFAPLGMTSTRFRPSTTWVSSIPPTEEDRNLRHRVLQGEVQDENCFVMGGVSGHAGLFSNALDPILFARCFLEDGRLSGGSQLFEPSTIRLFTTRAGLPPASSRALGWDTPSPPSSSGNFFSTRSAGHLGYSGTSLWIDFDRRLAVALLTNRTWPHRESGAIREVRPAFHDAVASALAEPAS